MSIRWIGAVLIVAGCGGCGLSIAAASAREQNQLERLFRALEVVEWEITYRLTPLPELCRLAGKEAGGALRPAFRALARALDAQAEPDPGKCMRTVLEQCPELTPRVRKLLLRLGASMGRYDLPGQVQGIQSVRTACREEEEHLKKDRDIRLRSYRILGLCAGAALVILLY